MKERIKELAVEAKLGSAATNSGSRYYIAPQEAFERFAELIVRECIGRCEGNGEYKNHTDSEWGQGLAAGIELCKETIKQHFGVEE